MNGCNASRLIVIASLVLGVRLVCGFLLMDVHDALSNLR